MYTAIPFCKRLVELDEAQLPIFGCGGPLVVTFEPVFNVLRPHSIGKHIAEVLHDLRHATLVVLVAAFVGLRIVKRILSKLQENRSFGPKVLWKLFALSHLCLTLLVQLCCRPPRAHFLTPKVA